MTQNSDLFGDPIPDNWGKRGRPQHIVTVENINKVTMLAAFGWSNERLANALHITLPTFRKHYFSLIKKVRDSARDRLDAAFAMKVWAQVEAGNVGAMRLWRDVLDRNDRMEIERAMAAAPADQPKSERVGKKVLDDRRAIDADADLMAELENEAAAENALH